MSRTASRRRSPTRVRAGQERRLGPQRRDPLFAGAWTCVSRVGNRGGPFSRHASRQSGDPACGAPVPPRWPALLVLFHGRSGEQRLIIADLEGVHATRRVLADVDGAVYALSGHVFFTREGALLAQAFDAEGMSLVGAPWQVAEDVSTAVTGGIGLSVSVSGSGSLIYSPQIKTARFSAA